ncbi:MAG TPA: hypothetical protein DCE56_14595 [Cyanobacteria bacterium UBA8553]|nr:hypothetical protein [Cyanobacteria bacterium UBA8553]HAJ64709.1 hypothetical protein [Cyanobacteria bacterium UBA8543]
MESSATINNELTMVKAMTAFTLPIKVDLKHVHLTDEQFYQLCINNRDLNIERSAKGALIFMAPVGGDSGNREIETSSMRSFMGGVVH